MSLDIVVAGIGALTPIYFFLYSMNSKLTKVITRTELCTACPIEKKGD